jgi:hypothetical protein
MAPTPPSRPKGHNNMISNQVDHTWAKMFRQGKQGICWGQRT